MISARLAFAVCVGGAHLLGLAALVAIVAARWGRHWGDSSPLNMPHGCQLAVAALATETSGALAARFPAAHARNNLTLLNLASRFWIRRLPVAVHCHLVVKR